MGVLKVSEGERHVALSARCVVGRHPRCDVRLVDRRASGEHAAIYWNDDHWEVRDLGSSNGTFVNGARIEPGQRVRLTEGCVISIGGKGTTLLLEDVGPPQAVARHLKSGRLCTAEGGMIVLPSEENPLVSIFEDSNGHWVAERDDSAEPLEDRAVFDVDGDKWQLQLPAPIESTLQSSGGLGPTLDVIQLRFVVSRDEEHVDALLVYRGLERRLATRAYHYMLVTLARLRNEDTEPAVGERGWVHREDLCRMLAIDNNKLNVDIFRARKQLAGMGVMGAAGLIERRASGHVRLGVSRARVETR